MSEDDAQDASTPEEGTGTSSSFKDKFATFKERTKEATSVAGSKAKSFAAQASEVTKEAAEVASEKSVKLAKQASKATKEAAAATGAKSKEIAQKAAEVTKKAADKTSVAVSSGLAQAKESVAEAKERRQATKDATTIVVESGQIDVGPDILDEPQSNHPTVSEGEDNVIQRNFEPEHSEVTSEGGHHGDFVIIPTLDNSNPDAQPKEVMTRAQRWARAGKDTATAALEQGPDFSIGWTVLAISVSTLASSVLLLSEYNQDLPKLTLTIPHVLLGFQSGHAWVQGLTAVLLLILLFDASALSLGATSMGSLRRLTLAFALIWSIPAFDGGPRMILQPFPDPLLYQVAWHVVVLPMAIMITGIRLELHRQQRSGSFLGSAEGQTYTGSIVHDSPSESNSGEDYNILEGLSMGLNDELNEKPRRREKMEFYEWVFFFFMWLFVFASVAMGIQAASINDGASSVLQSSYMPAIGLCMSLAIILAFILYKMDRSARSSIDMAKRRERYNAMQDEYWETRRVEFRLKREAMEQGKTARSADAIDA